MAQLNPHDYDFADEEPIKSKTQRAGEFLLGLGTRAAQGITNFAEAPSQTSQRLQRSSEKHLAPIINQLSPESKARLDIGTSQSEPISQKIERGVKSKFGESSIEPENFLSRGLQISAENLPGLIASAGTSSIPQILSSLPMSFAKSIPGSVGYAAAEEHTDNPAFKLAASFLADKGFKNLSGFINRKVKEGSTLNRLTSPKEISPLNKEKNRLYKEKDILGKDIKTETEPLKSGFREVEHKLSLDTAPSTTDKKEILDKIQTLERRFPTPNSTAAELANAKIEANKLFDQWSDKSVRKYFTEIRDTIENQLEAIGKNHPEWNKARKVADEIHTLQNWQPNLTKMITSVIPKGKIYEVAQSPLSQAALVALTGATGGPIAAGIASLPLAAKTGTEIVRAGRFINYLGSTKQGQKILFDIAADAAKGSESGLLKDIYALNKQAIKYEKENPNDYEFESTDLNPSDYEFAD